MGDFFGVDPKKVPIILLHRSTLCQTTWPPHPPAPLPQGASGEGLRRSQREYLTPSVASRRSGLVRLFLPPPQKSLPFFSAPKKPKKCTEVEQFAGVRRKKDRL